MNTLKIAARTERLNAGIPILRLNSLTDELLKHDVILVKIKLASTIDA